MSRHFVFGYGSLINADSRARTGCSGEAVLVRVRGLERAWNFVRCQITPHTHATLRAAGIPEADLERLAPLLGIEFHDRAHFLAEFARQVDLDSPLLARLPLFRQTSLGVIPRPEATTNGVLVSIPETELLRFDQREDGYARDPLHPCSVEALDGRPVPEGGIWVYRPQRPREAAVEYPILQSYLDVVLSGCLETGGEAFAREFARTTSLWTHWLDDRRQPRYTRALPHVHLAELIDRILSDEVGLAGRVTA